MRKQQYRAIKVFGQPASKKWSQNFNLCNLNPEPVLLKKEIALTAVKSPPC